MTESKHTVTQRAIAREEKVARTKTFWRRFWIVIALSPIVLPLLFYGCIRVTHPNAGAANIRVSKETTHVTAPLDAEGHVEFVVAINLHASEGVTAENNAAVLLMQAFGPDDSMSPALQAEFYRELGMEVPPADGQYFLTRDAFIEKYPELKPIAAKPGDEIGTRNWTLYKRQKAEREKRIEAELNDLIRQRDWSTFHAKLGEIPPPSQDADKIVGTQTLLALSYPWQKEDYPAVAAWLQENEQALADVIQASRRERFFVPLVSAVPAYRMLHAKGGGINNLRMASYAIAARAMLHLGEGNAGAAWDDLFAVHRLARLAGQQPTLIGALDSYGIEAVALEGDMSLMHHEELTSELAAQIVADLNALPPVADITVALDVGERLGFLDAAISFARHGLVEMDGNQRPMTFTQHWNLTLVNWNHVLADANRIYDEVIAETGTPADEIRATIDSGQHPVTIATSAFAGFQREKVVKSDLYGMMSVTLNVPFQVQRRTKEQVGLTKAAFAIAQYQAERGEYPSNLASLVPDYLPEIPTDVTLNQPFSYRTHDDGFVIYGWGTDDDDNGVSQARWETSDEDLGDGYDYVVEIPSRINVRYLNLVGP